MQVFNIKVFPLAYFVLRLLRVVLALLHRGGHLVHGRDDHATGLSQTLVGVGALRAINLEITKDVG